MSKHSPKPNPPKDATVVFSRLPLPLEDVNIASSFAVLCMFVFALFALLFAVFDQCDIRCDTSCRNSFVVIVFRLGKADVKSEAWGTGIAVCWLRICSARVIVAMEDASSAEAMVS